MLCVGVVLSATLVGCGSGAFDADARHALISTQCAGAEEVVAPATLVTLDWSGGVTPIYPDQLFDGLDLRLFETLEGGPLSDDEDYFKERVRAQGETIFCESPAPKVAVRHAADVRGYLGSTVYLTQSLSLLGGSEVGEGEFDPCDRDDENAAVVFGEQLRQLAGVLRFDEWVLIFANVTAHEVGHMLGYGHIDRDEYEPTGRALFVELMLDGHTISELKRQQRIVSDQTNCPDLPGEPARRIERPILTCPVVPADEME